MYSKKELIRFRHTDFAGIVFYPRFFEMLNDLVEDWFEEELERPFSKIHKTNGVPTVSLQVAFKQAAKIGDRITKMLWVDEIGTASVKLGFRFVAENGQTILEGQSTLVNVTLEKNGGNIESAPFDDEMREKMQRFFL